MSNGQRTDIMGPVFYQKNYDRMFENILILHPESFKNGWWLSELDSLGVTPNKVNELNDISEISSLTENLKQCYYQDYKGS